MAGWRLDGSLKLTAITANFFSRAVKTSRLNYFQKHPKDSDVFKNKTAQLSR